MGVKTETFVIFGAKLTKEMAKELHIYEDDYDEYEGSNKELAIAISKHDTIELVYDGMNGEGHYFGYVFGHADNYNGEDINVCIDEPGIECALTELDELFAQYPVLNDILDDRDPQLCVITHYS